MKVYFNLAVQPALELTDLQFQDAVVGLSTAVMTALKTLPAGLHVEFTAGKAEHIEQRDVFEFHRKMMVPMSPVPAFLDKDSHDYRRKFMQEELDEFQEAYEAGDLDKAFDSLIDLAYVTHGTALKMGLPWGTGWQRVHMANYTMKRLALPDGSDSKRGSPIDVIKIPGVFVAPSHWDSLRLSPGQEAPVFNAQAAIQHLTEHRRDGVPLKQPLDFVQWPAAMITGDGSGQALPEISPTTKTESQDAVQALDDTPLAGGCSDPGGTCESCQ